MSPPLRALALSLLLAPAASAQSPDAKMEAIGELMELTGAAALGQQMADQMMAHMAPMLRQAYPDVPPDMMDELLDEMRAEIRSVDMVALVGPVYDRHFTEEEIRGLIAFYETPLGRRTIERMPIVMQESMEAGQEWGEAAGQRVAEAVIQRLEEQGYGQKK